MAKGPSKSKDTAAGKAVKPKQSKAAAATKRTTRSTPKDPVKKRASTSRSPARDAAKLQAAVSSLYDTAVEIISDRLQPTVDQIKSLAQAVVGHEEKKVRKASRKATKPVTPKKAGGVKADRPAQTADKRKKKA